MSSSHHSTISAREIGPLWAAPEMEMSWSVLCLDVQTAAIRQSYCEIGGRGGY